MTGLSDKPLTVDQLNALATGTLVEGPCGDIYRKRGDRLWSAVDHTDLLDADEMVSAGGGCYLHHGDDSGDLEDASSSGAAGTRRPWMYDGLTSDEPASCGHCGGHMGTDDEGSVCLTCGRPPDAGPDFGRLPG